MNVTENDEKHSLIWRMFMSSTLESYVFMGKNYSDKCHSITNTKDITLKQMFDIPAKVVSEQDEIFGGKTVACHELTLPREEEASQPKGWIQGNTKIGPVLEIATCWSALRKERREDWACSQCFVRWGSTKVWNFQQTLRSVLPEGSDVCAIWR